MLEFFHTKMFHMKISTKFDIHRQTSSKVIVLLDGKADQQKWIFFFSLQQFLYFMNFVTL